MAFDAMAGRLRVGLVATDSSQDVLINAALSAALAFAENYCDRDFLYKRETITNAFDREYEGVFVNRYPIGRVYSVSNATTSSSLPASGWSAHNQSGLILIPSYTRRMPSRYAALPSVTIDYEGGYKVLPADLEYALWAIFDSVWPTFDPSISGGGIVGPAIGNVKKRTVVGVGSIEYETGGGASSSSTGRVSADWSAVMPGATQAVLGLYARKIA